MPVYFTSNFPPTRDPRKIEESLCHLHLASPTDSQGCGPLKSSTVCVLVCVCMHVKGRARNSQTVAPVSGKQFVLGAVREGSLGFLAFQIIVFNKQ